MVEQGVTFTNFFVNVSLCCPSRANILRGQYAHNTQILTNRLPTGGFQKFYALGHESSTVATWLQAAGYRTCYLGKYLNGYPASVSLTHVPPGWTEWYSPVEGNPYSNFNYVMNENGKLVRYGNRPEDYLTDVVARKSVDFIKRAAAEGQPFFIHLALYVPHSPATPAPRHAQLFADAQLPRPPSFNEADVSDKPGFIRNRPRGAASYGCAGGSQNPFGDQSRGRGQSQGTSQTVGKPGAAKCFDRTKVSRGDGHQLAFAVSRKCKTRLNVFSGQVGKVSQNLLFGHARCQVV